MATPEPSRETVAWPRTHTLQCDTFDLSVGGDSFACSYVSDVRVQSPVGACQRLSLCRHLISERVCERIQVES